MTPDQAGAASRKAVARLGTAYLECPRTLRRARELGLTGWAAYVAGRAGALGEVRPDTVTAALGLIAPEAVRSGWAAARAVLPPSQVAAHMLAECCRWGAERLEDAPRVARLVTLLETVAVDADGSALPLFAAWRAMPLPGGRVSFTYDSAPAAKAPSFADDVAALAGGPPDDDPPPVADPSVLFSAQLSSLGPRGLARRSPQTPPAREIRLGDAPTQRIDPPSQAGDAFSGAHGGAAAPQAQRGTPPSSGDAFDRGRSAQRGLATATSGPLDGPGARAAVALHLLAEHRAGALLVAIRAAGLSPVQALIAGPEGEAAAVAFGWQPPYPAPIPLLRRRAWADAITDHICGQVFKTLSEKEREELVDLLEQALSHVSLRDH